MNLKAFSLDELLRILLGGAVFVTVFVLTGPDRSSYRHMFSMSLTTTSITLLVLAAGTLIYLLHRSVIYPIIYGLLIWIWHRKLYRELSWWPSMIPYWVSKLEWACDGLRWRGRGHDKQSFHRHIVRWASEVHALYTSALATALALYSSETLVVTADALEKTRGAEATNPLVSPCVGWTLFLVLFGAGLLHHMRYIYMDYRICEMDKARLGSSHYCDC